MSRITKQQKTEITSRLVEKFGGDRWVSRTDIENVAAEIGVDRVSNSWIKDSRMQHGKYSVGILANMYGVAVGETVSEPVEASNVVNFPTTEVAPQVRSRVMTNTEENLVPEVDSLYVPTSYYDTIYTVLSSKAFYPMYITGQSGNGKSKSVVQAAAKAGRELIRINVTNGTDASELIGGFRLVNGETIYEEGPIVTAMKRGAIVLIDEIDLLNPNKAGELYTALEGSGVYIKEINSKVVPAPGFNVVATANTAGQGDDDGRYVGTGILSEAFLERFPITLRFDYPSKTQEKKILSKLFKKLGRESEEDKAFAKNLLDWIIVIRKTFEEGATEAVISTRRAVAIAEAYAIFGDRMKAIELCTNRFDEETRTSFLDLYTKIDDGVMTVPEDGEEVTENNEPVF